MSLDAAARPVESGVRKDGYVCSCLQVTERRLLKTLARLEVRTLGELRGAIGAGDGCTSCHPALRRYLAAVGQPSCPPICSASIEVRQPRPSG